MDQCHHHLEPKIRVKRSYKFFACNNKTPGCVPVGRPASDERPILPCPGCGKERRLVKESEVDFAYCPTCLDELKMYTAITFEDLLVEL